MDRLVLNNGSVLPMKSIKKVDDDLYIVFKDRVDATLIKPHLLSELYTQTYHKRVTGFYSGFDTIIECDKTSIHLRKIEYSDVQLAQQDIADSELMLLEAQQDITDTDIMNIETEQDGTDVDLCATEQGQSMTDYELELLMLM